MEKETKRTLLYIAFGIGLLALLMNLGSVLQFSHLLLQEPQMGEKRAA